MVQKDRERASPANTVGVIFAGGQSRRMGQAKASLEFSGEPLIARIERRFSGQCFAQAVSVREVGTLPTNSPQIIDDDPQKDGGPMIGVLSALKWAQSVRRCRFLLTTPVDTPFLPKEMLRILSAAMEDENIHSSVAMTEGQVHGLSALYDLSVLPRAEHIILENGERALKAFHQAIGSATVSFDGGLVDPFFNINTPDDLDHAQQLAKSHPTA